MLALYYVASKCNWWDNSADLPRFETE